MSKRICKNCGSIDIRTTKYSDGGKCYVCNDCCRIGLSDVFPEYTVFYRLTSSPETLAEKFVYYASVKIGRETRLGWLSTITGDRFYYLHSEAIAATVAELKKEWKSV